MLAMLNISSIIQAFLIFILLSSVTLADTAKQSDLLNTYHAIQNKQLSLLQDQPIHIKSNVTNNRLSADVYALSQYSFSEVVTKLSLVSNWCRFVTLHLNIKACTYQEKPRQTLSFFAGRKFYEPADEAYELHYQFNVLVSTPVYFKTELAADEGPFGTSDYQIVLEILKVKDDVVMHLSLSYQTSFASRLGSSVYLSTIGVDKVGFSNSLSNEDGFKYIGGIEGIIERNVMRYFLALNTYLDFHSKPLEMPKQWFIKTEKYATQLHEVELKEYLFAKQQELKQQAIMQNNINNGKSVFDGMFADDL